MWFAKTFEVRRKSSGVSWFPIIPVEVVPVVAGGDTRNAAHWAVATDVMTWDSTARPRFFEPPGCRQGMQVGFVGWRLAALHCALTSGMSVTHYLAGFAWEHLKWIRQKTKQRRWEDEQMASDSKVQANKTAAKKEQSGRKLKLNKETLRDLNETTLQQVAGGAISNGYVCEGYWRIFTR
jgi:hypothetical protein